MACFYQCPLYLVPLFVIIFESKCVLFLWDCLEFEMSRIYQSTCILHYGTAYDVLQFTYVSGPTVGLQFLFCFVGKTLNALVKLCIEPFQQFFSQWQHIFWAVAKGRDFKRVLVYPLPQVKAEASLIDGFLYVLIGARWASYLSHQSRAYRPLPHETVPSRWYLHP